jgi:hypothetical protein
VSPQIHTKPRFVGGLVPKIPFWWNFRTITTPNCRICSILSHIHSPPLDPSSVVFTMAEGLKVEYMGDEMLLIQLYSNVSQFSLHPAARMLLNKPHILANKHHLKTPLPLYCQLERGLKVEYNTGDEMLLI